ncbi:MAG TPA: hypothetical protein VEA99_15435, partial [Gemmatimonadaceae bacterium]|nr:hypothetical protein [Gemmatimonadaceae bacterium]
MADEDEWAEFRRTVEALEAELASHPGTAAYHRVDDLLRAWDVVDAAGRDLYALVMAGQEDRAFAVALIDWRGTGRDAFVKAADKALQ